jgi:uncharacterized LabA/DUF88 family protein
MTKSKSNYCFIDGQNLNLSIQEMGWKLDYKRFRIYLKEKYNVEKAYYFIGFIESNSILYQSLQEYGFILIFKPTLKSRDGRVKGNCDAELVLHSMIEYQNYNKAVIVTGDGDFACLIDYFSKQKKLEKLIVPNQEKYSALLRKYRSDIVFMNNLKQKLSYKNTTKKRGINLRNYLRCGLSS